MATMEKLDGSKVKLTITVTAEEFEEATQKAYLKTRGKFNVPGFRKGKAPRKMIESAYGEFAFFDEAFEIVYPEAYKKAIEETGIQPVGRPDISLDDFGKDKPLVFSVEVPVRPEVKLGEYKGIKVVKHEYNVTDEMVDAEIEREREKIARIVDVEGRAVENGDMIRLNYSGSVDGVKFDGGTAEDQQLIIGSGTFIPGFEEQLIGVNAGEEKDVKVTFPTEYHAEELAGKEAVFACKVLAIQKKELPVVDDEFAKDVSEFDTVAELREGKKKELEEGLKREAEEAKINDVVKAVTDNAQVEIPDVMIESQIDYMIQDISYRLSAQGMSIEDYVKFTGSTMEALRESFKGEAETRVKAQLVIDAVAKEEKIEASADEIEEAIKTYAARFGEEYAEKFISNLSEEDRLYFADQIVNDKTIKLLTDNAVEGTAKKKAASKKTAAAKAEGEEKKPAAKRTLKKAAEKKEEE
ncbi:MAG: trigger factor [Clostridia bacterium]|nr:trigger factor [Clostridia bacterium]